jgi:hypothetical protein
LTPGRSLALDRVKYLINRLPESLLGLCESPTDSLDGVQIFTARRAPILVRRKAFIVRNVRV